MKLAINYSPQAADLCKHGKIDFDYFKCPNWPDLIAEIARIKPVAVHFILSTTAQSIETANWNEIERLLAETDTPYINLHLWADHRAFPELPIEEFSQACEQQIVSGLIHLISPFVDRFGAGRVILENVPYRGKNSDVLRPVVEPSVIYRVIEETGCGLLLDIPHARIASHYLGVDEKDYISQLPVHRLRELHFTGLLKTETEFADHHLPAQDGDWQILDWVLTQIKSGAWSQPWMLAFEYGGVGEKFAWRSNPDVLARQVPDLYMRLKGLS